MYVKQLRDAGPVLLLDAGNALFESTFSADGKAKAKAELILRVMGEMKTAAMAVGARDLALGPEFLLQTSRKVGVPVLSANLTRDSKPIFPASTVVTASGVKVGLVGVSPAIQGLDRYPGLRGEPPVRAALAEAAKLRGKVDLLIALAAVSWADALQLSKEGAGVFDFVIQSGEQRGAGVMQRNDRNFVLSAGERGRAVSKLDLDLSGSGPLVDLAEIERDRARRRNLEMQIESVKQRVAGERDPAILKSYQQTLASFQDQLQQLRQNDPEARAKGARTARLAIQFLDESVASDPALKAEVDKYGPPPEH